jgi:hypothetical protein
MRRLKSKHKTIADNSRIEHAASDLEELYDKNLSFNEQAAAIANFIQTFYQRAFTLEEACAMDRCLALRSLTTLVINRWPTAALYVGMRFEVYKNKKAAGSQPAAQPIGVLRAKQNQSLKPRCQ